jgi:hypothetical protein
MIPKLYSSLNHLHNSRKGRGDTALFYIAMALVILVLLYILLNGKF